MNSPNTRASLRADLEQLGVSEGMAVMVHSSLGQVGWTVGGDVTVVRALLDVLGELGTLVMPAESPPCAHPKEWADPVPEEWHPTIVEHLPVFDPLTTPTTMGAVAEAFRTFPGTVRSLHPTVSVCANGQLAAQIISDHPLAFCEGPGSPFETMYELDAHTLLLGVGFESCTFLHYAESLSQNRRTTVNCVLVEQDDHREWVEVPNMATDAGVLFRPAGEDFMLRGQAATGHVGAAETLLFPARDLVNSARRYFDHALAAPT